MNQYIGMGRLTRDPEVRYSQGEKSMAIAKYTIAVDRKGRPDPDGADADFINVVAFDRAGEFAERYFRKGMRVIVRGRVRTSSYTNRDGVKIPTFEVYVEEQDFADSKDSGNNGNGGSGAGQQVSNNSRAAGGFSNGQNARNGGSTYGNSGNTNNRTARSRNAQRGYSGAVNSDGFMNVPDSADDSGMPF